MNKSKNSTFLFPKKLEQTKSTLIRKIHENEDLKCQIYELRNLEQENGELKSSLTENSKLLVAMESVFWTATKVQFGDKRTSQQRTGIQQPRKYQNGGLALDFKKIARRTGIPTRTTRQRLFFNQTNKPISSLQIFAKNQNSKFPISKKKKTN